MTTITTKYYSMKKNKNPKIEWFDPKQLPSKIRTERNISKDVLIYDLDTKKMYIGYYSFSNMFWVIDNEMKSVEQPINFVWAYLN